MSSTSSQPGNFWRVVTREVHEVAWRAQLILPIAWCVMYGAFESNALFFNYAWFEIWTGFEIRGHSQLYWLLAVAYFTNSFWPDSLLDPALSACPGRLY